MRPPTRQRRTTRSAGILLALAAVLVAGCEPRAKGKAGEGAEAVKDESPERRKAVAKIGDKTLVSVGQLTDALNRQNPYIRMRYTSLERKKEYLKNMVRLELLAREAKKRKLHQDPEVVRRVKRVMVDRLMEALRKELVKFDDVTDADARAYYDKNKQLYQRAEQVRISQIVVKTAAEAQQVLAAAQQKPGNVRHFNGLVAEHSVDAATKGRHGNVDFFGADDEKLPPALVKAAFGLKKMWEIGGPVKIDQRHVVLMKTGHRPALDRAFDAEKNRIKNRLFNERRFAAVNRFVEQLQAKAKVEVIEANLGKVEIDQPPAGGPKGAAAGKVPSRPKPPHGHKH